MGELEAADSRLHRAREGAFGVPEQLRFGEWFRDRGGVEADETLVGARAVVMDRPRDQLLAGAGLALDQHGAVHRRDKFENGEDMAHRRAVADHAVEAVPIAELGAEVGVLFAQASLFHRRRQDAGQLRQLERLDQEVDGAPTHGRHRFGDATEPGDHDRQDVGVAANGRVEHVQTIRVRQAQVDDDGVVGKALEAVEGVCAVGALGHDKSLVREGFGDGLAKFGFVLDDEDGWLRTRTHGHLPAGHDRAGE